MAGVDEAATPGTGPPPGRVERHALGGDVFYTGAALELTAPGAPSSWLPHGPGVAWLAAGADATALEDAPVVYTGAFDRGARHGWGVLERRSSGRPPAVTVLTTEWAGDVPQLCSPCGLAEHEERGMQSGAVRRRPRWKYAGLVAIVRGGDAGGGFDGLRWALETEFVADALGERIDVAAGERYCGEFQAGRRHGFGVTATLGGHAVTYIGQFDGGRRHGLGAVRNEASGTALDGMWSDGALSPAYPATFTDRHHPHVAVQGQRWAVPDPRASAPSLTGPAPPFGAACVPRGSLVRAAMGGGGGIWEPLFAGLDAVLPGLAADHDLGAPGPADTDPTALLVRCALTLPAARTALAVFQRCVMFAWGTCDGARGEMGAGPSAKAPAEGPNPSGAAAPGSAAIGALPTSWCTLTQFASGRLRHGVPCVHRGCGGREATARGLDACLEDLRSMVVSLRLRLMGIAHAHEAAAITPAASPARDDGPPTAAPAVLATSGTRGARLGNALWDAVASVALPVALGVAAHITLAQSTALALAVRRLGRRAAAVAAGSGAAPSEALLLSFLAGEAQASALLAAARQGLAAAAPLPPPDDANADEAAAAQQAAEAALRPLGDDWRQQLDPAAVLPPATEPSPAAVVAACALRLRHTVAAPPAEVPPPRSENTAVGPLFVSDWLPPADSSGGDGGQSPVASPRGGAVGGRRRGRGFDGALSRRVELLAAVMLVLRRLAAWLCAGRPAGSVDTSGDVLEALARCATALALGRCPPESAVSAVAWLHVLRRATACDGAPGASSGGFFLLSPLGHWALTRLVAAVAHVANTDTLRLRPGGCPVAPDQSPLLLGPCPPPSLPDRLLRLRHVFAAAAPRANRPVFPPQRPSAVLPARDAGGCCPVCCGPGRLADAAATPAALGCPVAALAAGVALADARHEAVALAAAALVAAPQSGLLEVVPRSPHIVSDDPPYIAALDFAYHALAAVEAGAAPPGPTFVPLCGRGADVSLAVRERYTTSGASQRLAGIAALALAAGGVRLVVEDVLPNSDTESSSPSSTSGMSDDEGSDDAVGFTIAVERDIDAAELAAPTTMLRLVLRQWLRQRAALVAL